MTRSAVLDQLYATREFLEIEACTGMALPPSERERLGEELEQLNRRIARLERE